MVAGIMIPSSRASLRLIASLKMVGGTIGRSPGFAPRKIKLNERRKAS